MSTVFDPVLENPPERPVTGRDSVAKVSRQYQRILVLGAGGFIGRQVAQLLADDPGTSETLCLERNPKSRVAINGKVEWCWLDLATCSPRSMAHVFRRLGPDVIVNCAGSLSGTRPVLKLLNLVIVSNLVEVLQSSYPVPLVHLGSAAEYGPAGRWAPLDEASLTRPNTDYGATKLAATELLLTAAARHRISATVLRVFNPVGPGSPPTTLVGRAVGVFRQAITSGASTATFGRLDSVRDFIDVRDVGTAVLAAARHPPERAALFNIGRGIPVSCRWLVWRLAEIAGYKGNIVENGLGSPRSNGLDGQWADISAARAELGWSPEHLLSDALAHAWLGPA